MTSKGAIEDLTKGIEIDPNEFVYYLRGVSKNNLKDYYGAIADYTKAIALEPNYFNAYHNRAISKYYLNNIKGACKDARKAQELGYDASRFINAECN